MHETQGWGLSAQETEDWQEGGCAHKVQCVDICAPLEQLLQKRRVAIPRGDVYELPVGKELRKKAVPLCSASTKPCRPRPSSVKRTSL